MFRISYPIKRKGFTLIEMLVVMAVFLVLMGIVVGVFVSSLRTQRYYLSSQKLLDQTSYVIEYMNRAVRMAKKQTSDTPSCVIRGDGYNYENTGGLGSGLGIRFIRVINGEKKCQEFYLENDDRIYQKIDGGAPMALTSNDIKVNSLKFNLLGEFQGVPGAEDTDQPRVTIYLDAEANNVSSAPKIKIQTSVSQRDLDVIE